MPRADGRADGPVSNQDRTRIAAARTVQCYGLAAGSACRSLTCSAKAPGKLTDRGLRGLPSRGWFTQLSE